MWFAVISLYTDHTDEDEDVILAHGTDENRVRALGEWEAWNRNVSASSVRVYKATESHRADFQIPVWGI